MAITSMDQLVSSLSTGKTWRTDWNKITAAVAYTAGRWYDFSQLAGTPVANAYAGTAKAWTACDEATGNGSTVFGLRHGGDVSTDLKSALNVSAITSSATGVPAQLMLVDMCGYYPGISLASAASQTLTGTPTLRYTNGAGVRAFISVTTASGATASNFLTSYTNQSATSGRTLPVTVAGTPSAIVAHLSHSGTAGNNYGPFLPLASGDTGIQSVQSVQLSASTGAGVAALVLAKPILTLPLTTVSVAGERDLLNQVPSLPKIPDGACLTWLYFSGAATAANSSFYGATEFVWG